MDIFNKRKVAKLEGEIKDLEEALSELRGYEEENAVLNEIIEERNLIKKQLETEIEKLNEELEKIKTEIGKIEPSYTSIKESIEKYRDLEIFNDNIEQISFSKKDDDLISRYSLSMKYNSMDDEELKKELDENREQINNLVESYEKRYTSKANLTIFRFMVIALKSELQNIIHNLENKDIEECKKDIKFITEKFLIVAEGGNKQVLGSITKFISEIEGLFVREVEISIKSIKK